MNLDPILFARMTSLFDVGLLREARVLIAGCGSGGSQVAQQLCMAGIHRFTLFDHDALETANVIRHACGLRYVGQRKVDALAAVLRDRNPAVEIDCRDQDLMTASDLAAEVARSTVVVLATDNEPTRFKVNQLCVDQQRPFVVGRVFTRGIGGEVFAYRPGETGCLACLESVLARTFYREGVAEIDLLTEEEREAVYGMDLAQLKDSPGLNVDIAFITSFHTRFVLDAVARALPARPACLPAIGTDGVIWGNRPERPFSRYFELQRLRLAPQAGCRVCSKEGRV